MDLNQLEKLASETNNLNVIRKLLCGRESMNELLTSLNQLLFSPGYLVLAKDHAKSVLSNINDSLSLLSCDQQISSQVRTKTCSLSSDGRMYSEIPSLLGIHGSGCSKTRRKPSWTRSTPILIDDDYAWRKYGQKPIQNTPYPRSYYKCTHSPSCEALKQVQMIDDKPSMYKITYTSHHTCKRGFANPAYMESRMKNSNSSVLINFASETADSRSSGKLEEPSPADWWPLKQEENVPVNKYLSPDNYHPPLSDITPDLLINELYLHPGDEKKVPTIFETASNHCYLDGPSFMIDSMDGYEEGMNT